MWTQGERRRRGEGEKESRGAVKQMERGVMAEDEEKAEAGEVEKERGEQGSQVKQREMEVMAEDEEEKAEAGEVEKERFRCSDCEKDYAFLHKLLHQKTRNCKKKEEVGVAKRPLSSNVFSLESEEGEKEKRGKGEEEERGKEEEEPSEVLEKSTVSIKYTSLYVCV